MTKQAVNLDNVLPSYSSDDELDMAIKEALNLKFDTMREPHNVHEVTDADYMDVVTDADYPDPPEPVSNNRRKTRQEKARIKQQRRASRHKVRQSLSVRLAAEQYYDECAVGGPDAYARLTRPGVDDTIN